MKICQISTHDIAGGAARAAYRLHQGLCHLHIDSQLYVLNKLSRDDRVLAFTPSAKFWPQLQRFVRHKRIQRSFDQYRSSRPGGLEIFSDDRSHFGAAPLTQLPVCDVIHLHWIARFIDYTTFFGHIHKPIIWTLHDMNPFSGGCHYSDGCRHYTDQCGHCPQLGSQLWHDLSASVLHRKQKALSQLQPGQLHIVTPSRWLAHQAKQSTLFRQLPISVIPYGLDTHKFAPQNSSASRHILGIPQSARVILFAASNLSTQRKGFGLLQEALNNLAADDRIFLLSVGYGVTNLAATIPHRHVETVNDDRLLSAIYSAADIFVIPSIEDNLPNTVLEAMACGTPVVGFDVGGIPDMVRPGITGELAPAGDVARLSQVIQALLETPEKRHELAANCRRIAEEEYALDLQAHRYMALYKQMLEINS